MRALVLALSLICGPMLLALDLSQDITPENVAALINAYRAEKGLLPLRIDSRLTRAANLRMEDMLAGGWWCHKSPEGRSPFDWLPVAGYKHSMAAENLANGFDTAQVLVETWMESPGHRANILGAAYSDCGIAVIEGSTKGPASGKSVIVLFGRRLAEAVMASQP